MARRRARTLPGGDLRAVLAARERDSFADYHRRLDPYGRERPSLVAEALDAGEPVVFHGWELVRFVPGVEVNANYRVERDGSLTMVASVSGPRHGPIRWEPVR